MLFVLFIDFSYDGCLHRIAILLRRTGKNILVFCEMHALFLVETMVASLYQSYLRRVVVTLLEGVVVGRLAIIRVEAFRMCESIDLPRRKPSYLN